LKISSSAASTRTGAPLKYLDLPLAADINKIPAIESEQAIFPYIHVIQDVSDDHVDQRYGPLRRQSEGLAVRCFSILRVVGKLNIRALAKTLKCAH